MGSHLEVLPVVEALLSVRVKHTVFSSLEPYLLAGTPTRDKFPVQTALKSSHSSKDITTFGRKCARIRPVTLVPTANGTETSASLAPIPMFVFPIGNTEVVEEARQPVQLPTETRMPLWASCWQ